MLRIDRRVLRNDGSVFLFFDLQVRIVLRCLFPDGDQLRIHWVTDVMFWCMRNEALSCSVRSEC